MKCFAAILALLSAAPALAGDVVACNLRGLTAEQRTRHQALSEKLLAAVSERVELDDGFKLKLGSEAVLEAAEWVGYEHKCCPFFTLALEQTRDEGPLWLKITGSEGVKAFIRREFKLK